MGYHPDILRDFLRSDSSAASVGATTHPHEGVDPTSVSHRASAGQGAIR